MVVVDACNLAIMRFLTAASSGLEPAAWRIVIYAVERYPGHFRVDGDSTPAWLGPPEDASVTVSGSIARVDIVEVGLAGRFALEAEAELRDGDTVRLRLGEAWALLQVFDD